MKIRIPILANYSLVFSDEVDTGNHFPTSALQKGLLLFNGEEPLTGEAVGFGMPVVKSGLQTVFPGSAKAFVDHTGDIWKIRVDYQLNLVEKISNSKRAYVENRLLYSCKNLLAGMIRRIPFSRAFLSSSSRLLRKIFQLGTGYAQSSEIAEISVSQVIKENSGVIHVEVDANRLPGEISEVIIMNEQSARYFQTYGDSTGRVIRKEKIGCWDQVKASSAWFQSSFPQVKFILEMLEGIKLYRGLEMVDDRLAWAGFGYSFPPAQKHLSYQLKIETKL